MIGNIPLSLALLHIQFFTLIFFCWNVVLTPATLLMAIVFSSRPAILSIRELQVTCRIPGRDLALTRHENWNISKAIADVKSY